MLHQQDWPMESRQQLSRQVARLGNELDAISRTVQRMGATTGRQAGDTAAHLAGEALQYGEALAHDIGRRARRVGGKVRKDPVPAIVAVAGVLLLLSLLFGRRR